MDSMALIAILKLSGLCTTCRGRACRPTGFATSSSCGQCWGCNPCPSLHRCGFVWLLFCVRAIVPVYVSLWVSLAATLLSLCWSFLHWAVHLRFLGSNVCQKRFQQAELVRSGQLDLHCHGQARLPAATSSAVSAAVQELSMFVRPCGSSSCVLMFNLHYMNKLVSC